MNKKGDMGKNIVIVILLLVICILSGAFYYLYAHRDNIFNKCPSVATCNCSKD